MLHLTEDEKIRNVIEKYENFFQNTISDVARTKKGVWIFFEYDADHDCYNSFFRFKTAEELKQIIAGVVAWEMNMLIEVAAENIQNELEGFDINDVAQSYNTSIPLLLKNVEILK